MQKMPCFVQQVVMNSIEMQLKEMLYSHWRLALTKLKQ